MKVKTTKRQNIAEHVTSRNNVMSTPVVELKAVEKLIPVHSAQLLSYLKLSKLRLGFLINFNSTLIKDGIKRMML